MEWMLILEVHPQFAGKCNWETFESDYWGWLLEKQPKLDGGIDTDYLKSVLDKCKNTEETILVKREMKIKDKYFNIEE